MLHEETVRVVRRFGLTFLILLLEWGHRALTELRLVDDMHERKRTMLSPPRGP